MPKGLLIKFFTFFLFVFAFNSSNLFCDSNTNTDYSQTNGNSQFNKWTKSNNMIFAKQKKSVAIILCFCLGNLGAHRFYVGKTGTAILQLLTFGGFEIWKWIDLLLILCDNFENDEGKKLCPYGI